MSEKTEISQQDIDRIEEFTIWAKKRGLHFTLFVHRAPIGELKKTGKYIVELITADDGRNFFTAKPKDVRLQDLKYFE